MGDTVNGTSFIGVDKFFRRLGMVYGAEHASMIEADPETKAVCDAYTAGVNAYIKTLDESSMRSNTNCSITNQNHGPI